MAEAARPTLAADRDVEPDVRDFVALLKPRVMSLVVFTGAAGLVLAPGAIHPVLAMVAVLCIAIGAGASGAINMWYDADIDAVMARTVGRPIPAGRMRKDTALGFGCILAFGSVALLGLALNWVAAAILAITIAFYVFVYTMWLKRRTPQNIVIGGAAGAFPPMIGWAVATGGISIESVLMFALTFAWTPPHFWALALFTKGDYANAGVPMLTVTHGRRATRAHILGYSLVLAVVAIALGLTSIGGPVYMVVALILNGMFIKGAWDVFRRDDVASDADKHKAERRLFKLSLAYLFLHYGALLVEASLKPFGLGGWG